MLVGFLVECLGEVGHVYEGILLSERIKSICQVSEPHQNFVFC